MRGTKVIIELRPGITHDEQAAAIERLTQDPDVADWQCNNWKVGRAIQHRGRISFRWLGKGEGHRVVRNA
jgi:hypothetical protein